MTTEVAGSSPALRAVGDKLYAIGRRDLSPGLRCAQIGHALITWTLKHGEPPDNLVILEVDNLDELHALARQLPEAVCFYEPDLGSELTAIALVPRRKLLLRGLRLMR